MADYRHLDNLINIFKGGDTSVFDEIYEETHKAVYYAIYYIVKEKDYSEDILQDTYVSAIKHIDSYTLGTNFQGWLVQIGKNLAKNHFNKAKREVPYDFDKNPSIIGQYSIKEKEYGAIEIAKNMLSEEDFSILMLIAVEGYKRREISEMMNLPISTVTWKYKQSIDTLRAEIEKINNEN